MVNLLEIETKINDFFQLAPHTADVPVIAFVISRSGEIVSSGVNDREAQHKISGHAEINALNTAAQMLKTSNLQDYQIVSSLEPCMMCLGAIVEAQIKTIYYYATSPKTGFVESNHTFDIFQLKTVKINNNFSQQITQKMQKFFVKLRG